MLTELVHALRVLGVVIDEHLVKKNSLNDTMEKVAPIVTPLPKKLLKKLFTRKKVSKQSM